MTTDLLMLTWAAALMTVAKRTGSAYAASAAADNFGVRAAHLLFYATYLPSGRTLSIAIGWLAMDSIFYQTVILGPA